MSSTPGNLNRSRPKPHRFRSKYIWCTVLLILALTNSGSLRRFSSLQTRHMTTCWVSSEDEYGLRHAETPCRVVDDLITSNKNRWRIVHNLTCERTVNDACEDPEGRNEPCKLPPRVILEPDNWVSPYKDGNEPGDIYHTVQPADALTRDILDLLADKGMFDNKYAVDFGCRWTRESFWYDPCHGLWAHRGWSGLCFDTEPNLLELRTEFKEKRKMNTVSFHSVLLDPTNVATYLGKQAVPKDLDFLKVDIDSFDCQLVRKLLEAGYRPKVWLMEHMGFSSYPRTVRYEAHMGSKLGGCSCEAASSLGAQYGYKMITSFGLDVIMIRADIMLLGKASRKFSFDISKGCSRTCGTAFCRRENQTCAQFLQMYDQLKYNAMVELTANLECPQESDVHISSDFGSLNVKCLGSGETERFHRKAEYERIDTGAHVYVAQLL